MDKELRQLQQVFKDSDVLVQKCGIGKVNAALGAQKMINEFHPDCIIVDFSIGRAEALQICQNLRRNPEFGEIILIALLPDDGSSTSFDRSSINETFRKPFDSALLAERLRSLVGSKKELGVV